MLSYRIDLYFHDSRLAIEIHKNRQNDRNIDYEIKSQTATEREIDYVFNKIDPEKEGFDIFRLINEIFKHIKQFLKPFLQDNCNTYNMNDNQKK